MTYCLGKQKLNKLIDKYENEKNERLAFTKKWADKLREDLSCLDPIPGKTKILMPFLCFFSKLVEVDIKYYIKVNHDQTYITIKYGVDDNQCIRIVPQTKTDGVVETVIFSMSNDYNKKSINYDELLNNIIEKLYFKYFPEGYKTNDM